MASNPEATKVGVGASDKGGDEADKVLSPAGSPMSQVSHAARRLEFTLMDMVEDGVRVRFLNVWAIMLIYVFLVFGFLTVAKDIAPAITKVDISTPMPHSRRAGKEDEATAILEGRPRVTPKVVMFDQHGRPMRGVSAHTEIFDFQSDGPVDCSHSTCSERKDTLQEFNYKDLCFYELVGNQSGQAEGLSAVAAFDAFEISGPTGVYSLKVVSGPVSAASTQKVAVVTPVLRLWVVNADTGEELQPPEKLTIGALLDPQPAVLLLDGAGLPVANRTVTVFPNPDPTWPPSGQSAQDPPTYGERGQKVAELECATSEPSDANGLAKFTCLKVLGSTVSHINWVFSESGLNFRPWNDPTTSPNTLYPMNVAVFRPPTYLDSRRVRTVETKHSPYSRVVEGQAFNPQPTVLVKDSSGLPLSGVTCYAMITKWGNQYYPLFFQRDRKGLKRKVLYNVKAETGNDGIAVWDNLTLSVPGNTIYEEGLRRESNSSMYIGFVCDGVFQVGAEYWETNGGHVAEVESTVAAVQIKRFTSVSAQLTSYTSGDSADSSALFTTVVRVLDADGKGVPGKNIIVEPAYLDSGFVAKNVPDMMEATKDSGFAVVSFVVVVAPEAISTSGSATFKVRFSVDGVLSSESEDLTLRMPGQYDVTQCNMVSVSTVRVLDNGGNIDFNVHEEIPHAIPGSHFQVFLTLRGQTVGTCTHFPNLVGGSEFVDTSGCGTIGSGRLLSEQEEDPEFVQLYQEAERRLRQEPQRQHRTQRQRRERRLASSSSDGSIEVRLKSAYSNNGETICSGGGECELQVPHLPRDLLDVHVLEEVQPPPLVNLSAAPGEFPVSVMALGANGDHFLKFVVAIKSDENSKAVECETPPIQIRIANPVYALFVFGDNEDQLYGQMVEAGTFLPLSFFVISLLDGSNYSLASSKYAENGVYWRWVEYPARVDQQFYSSSVPPQQDSEFWTVSELDAAGNAVAPGEGWEGGSYSLRLGVKIKKPGMFGRYAIQFGLAGLWSRVVTFTVKRPSDLKVVIQTEPAHNVVDSSGLIKTLTFLSQQPAVVVTAGGSPLEGAVVTAEFVPFSGGGLFDRLTDIEGYSPLPMIYSSPSDSNGIAQWSMLAMIDGYGCGQYKFVLVYDEVESDMSMSTLCFGNAFQFEIKSQPPSSMPLDMPLSAIASGAPMTVEARLSDGVMPNLTCPFDTTGVEKVCPSWGYGFMAMRVLVAEAGGTSLTLDESKAATSAMLEEQVCVWVGMIEVAGRCSNLEIVQTEPYILLKFQIMTLRWKRITTYPADMKLMVTDLSGTDYLWQISSPSGLSSSPETLALQCVESLMYSSQLRKAYLTHQIKAETTLASAMVVLPPPELAVVGEAFLVRIQVLTKQGSPVVGKLMRACLASVGTTNPEKASPSFLHKLTNLGGFTQSSTCGGEDAYFSSAGTLRKSDNDGIISFPLTIQAAQSGTYVVHFQPEEPGSKIQVTTSKFRVFNQINSVTNAEGGWGTLDVPEFGVSVDVPRKPLFKVEPYSLEELEEGGIPIELKLSVAAASTKQSAVKKKLQEARKLAKELAMKKAREKLAEVREAAAAVLSLVDTAAEKVEKGIFSMFSSDFAATCLGTRATSLATGDAKANVNDTEVQETSMADEVQYDQDVVDPSDLLSTFVSTFSAGGNEMKSRHESQPYLTLTLDASQIERVPSDSGYVYTLKDSFQLNFQPDFEYRLKLRINGVESSLDDFPAFSVKEAPLPWEDLVLAWVLNALSAILACIILITNTRKHHRAWFLFAFLATAAVMGAVPYIKDKDQAMGGHWKWIAICNLVLIAVSLIFGYFCETMPTAPFFSPFEAKRQKIYDEYAARRTRELLLAKELPKRASTLQNLVDVVRPFSSKTAFYYPSGFITALFIGISSFAYVIIWIINVRHGVEEQLEALKQRAVAALFKQIVNMGEQFYQAVGQDLPDEAQKFMYNQLELVVSWFDDLVAAVELALTIGIVVAALCVILCMVFSFYDFRLKALGMRQGHRYGPGGKMNVESSPTFVGFFITALFAGFAMVAFLVTLVILPFVWPLTWEMIWGKRWVIVTLLIPHVIHSVVKKSIVKCAYAGDHITNRFIASIVYFWQLYLSLVAGIAGAAIRFVMGLVGLLLRVPMVALPISPEDEYSLVKDAQHQAYLSAIFTHHILNAPLFAVAAKRLWNICAARRHFEERKKHWTSTRSMVILLLIRFPMLKRYRKAALAAQRAELERRKKMDLKALLQHEVHLAEQAAAAAGHKMANSLKGAAEQHFHKFEGSRSVVPHSVVPSEKASATL